MPAEKRPRSSAENVFLQPDAVKKMKLDEEGETALVLGAKPAGKKPILVMLPGASGGFTGDFADLLLPRLKERFEVRIRPAAKWKGWDPFSNAQRTVESLCPSEVDAEPWYLLGGSFGNRVAVSIVAENLTPVTPSLILTGYPMYGPNGKDDRVKHIKTLPASANVLAISGDKDEYLNKNVPDGKSKGEALWKEVFDSLPCKGSTTLHIMPKGGHGVYPSAKGKKVEATGQIMKWINDFCI